MPGWVVEEKRPEYMLPPRDSLKLSRHPEAESDGTGKDSPC